MNKVFLKNVAIGPGRPKVAIPVMKPDKESLIAQVKSIVSKKKADLIEWRADWYEGILDENAKVDEALLLDTLKSLSEAADKVPVCFTYRTKEDGGNGDIDALCYEHMLGLVAASGYADIIDVELFRGEELFKRVIKVVHSYHTPVLGSNHDFEKTPAKEEILERLKTMQSLGADVCKIAVMPQKKQDVFNLIDAALTMNERYAQQPIVAISMGREGAFSRIAGEFFGSAITFGADEQESAPGQVEAGKLLDILSDIHSVL